MNIASQPNSVTFPHGFLDFLRVSQHRRHRVGNCELQPERLERYNEVLHAISPNAPRLTLDQMATAAQRALDHHGKDAKTPPFVQSRMAVLRRLEGMSADAAWQPSDEARRVVALLCAYRDDTNDLIPDEEPVIGLLDDAVLVDVALQLLRDELADYEDFCRFRRVAAEFAGLPENETGLTRAHWLEAMLQAHSSVGRLDGTPRQQYAPDPRASLFHIT